MADLAALAATARDLLPPGCGIGVADPAGEYPAFPGESVAGIPRRQREFRAGRVAARVALAELGLPPCAIPAGPDRAPLWPAGIAGSISHSADAALAVAGRLRGIGVDLEPDRPLDPALHATILRPDEAGADPLAVFVAKEAAYKAQYPLSRRIFDFHTLSVSMGAGRFTARYTEAIAPFPAGAVLEGRLIRVAGHVLAIVTL